SMGRYPEAEPLYAQAVSVWLQVLGPDHPNTRTGIDNFAGCLQQAIAAGQVGQLSDHPLTQWLLQVIQQGQ
ncbi:MAG: tetratricopeptide repeat protein, partial [Leptolyngbya sp. SIO4C5]|nr:tetratricopeptide repeat protein [Leptolyngbya sp. SIO4C5]